MEVTVADDGEGFEPRSAERSFGLVGMEERVTLVRRERFEIESEPGRGTQVRAELPLSRPRQAGRSPTASDQRLVARLAPLLILEQPVLAGERDRLGPAARVELAMDRRIDGSRRCGC